MKVLSWNIKSFVSAIENGYEAATVIKQIMNTFDLIAIYELSNSANGKLEELVGDLNELAGNEQPDGRAYDCFHEPTGGLDKEDDQVGVIYDTNIVTVANATAARRGNAFTSNGRAPAYFSVADNTTTREFCAWHAPQPTNAAHLIAQSWQTILRNCVNQANRGAITYIVMGDFNNGDLRIGRRSPANYLKPQITTGGGTTLKPKMQQQPQSTTAGYRTTNLYDQFFVDTSTLNVTLAGTWIYDVLDLLDNDRAPLTGLFGTRYTSPPKAHAFYGPNVSDHLPVSLEVDF